MTDNKREGGKEQRSNREERNTMNGDRQKLFPVRANTHCAVDF